MDSRHCEKRSSVDGDRLSSLSDDLIHKILSSLDIKHVVETSVLSSRWRYIWTSMPFLNFSKEVFSSLPKFSRFVTQVLSRRNNDTNVVSVEFSLRGRISQVFVKKILKYALSHNVQQMTITQLLKSRQTEFPLSLLRCHSLEDLTLIDFQINHFVMPSSTWDLPALTTLCLDHVTLFDNANDKFNGLFSDCTNLKNLTLRKCKFKVTNGLSICHPQLSNLVLDEPYFYHYEVSQPKPVKVVAPQLKNQSIVLRYYIPHFKFDCLSSLEKVNLCMMTYETHAPKILGLLQQFTGVKFLTLNLEFIEALSSSVELISNQPSPFANLKNLTVYPKDIYSVGQAQEKINVSTEVKNYFLDSSPGATFTIVSHEEMSSVSNATLAQKLMAELRMLLYQEKAKTNNADHQNTQMKSHKAKMPDQGKTRVQNKEEQAGMNKPLHIGGKMAQIQSCWEDLNKHIQLETERGQRIFSRLKNIEELLTLLPASKRVRMEPCFFSLCAQANTIMNEVVSNLKIHCDTKQRCLNVNFEELAEINVQPPS